MSVCAPIGFHIDRKPIQEQLKQLPSFPTRQHSKDIVIFRRKWEICATMGDKKLLMMIKKHSIWECSAVINHEAVSSNLCTWISGLSKSFPFQLWVNQIKKKQWSGMVVAPSNRTGNDVCSQILPDYPISVTLGFADHPWKQMIRLHQPNWAIQTGSSHWNHPLIHHIYRMHSKAWSQC